MQVRFLPLQPKFMPACGVGHVISRKDELAGSTPAVGSRFITGSRTLLAPAEGFKTGLIPGTVSIFR